MAYGTGLLRLLALKSEPKQMFAKETAFELLTPPATWWTPYRHPVIFSDDEWDVQAPPKCIFFWFHYHSKEVIGSLTVRITDIWTGSHNPILRGWKRFITMVILKTCSPARDSTWLFLSVRDWNFVCSRKLQLSCASNPFENHQSIRKKFGHFSDFSCVFSCLPGLSKLGLGILFNNNSESATFFFNKELW